MIALEFDETVSSPTLRRLDGNEAFRWLRTSAFRFLIDAPEVDLHDFTKVAELHAACPIFELRRRRSLDQLPQVTGLVARLMNHAPKSGSVDR
jgi:hypothetical protein